MMRRLRLVAAIVVVLVLFAECTFGQGAFARVSPFTEVDVVGDVARVTYQGKAYELVSVEAVPTDKILAFCRDEYERRWEERFATDLVEVMGELGKRVGATVRLELREPATGEVVTVERAAMTRENREAARVALLNRPWTRITPTQMREAADAFERALEAQWSYLRPSEFDHRPMIADVRKRIDGGVPVGEFLIDLQRVVARGIDGHAEVRDWERFAPSGYLPFLIDSAGDRFVRSMRTGGVSSAMGIRTSKRLTGSRWRSGSGPRMRSSRGVRRNTCGSTGCGTFGRSSFCGRNLGCRRRRMSKLC